MFDACSLSLNVDFLIFPGIEAKLPYLSELGIGIVWLSPIFESPMADFGYDISNFTDIDPIFGTMEDFDALVANAHSLGETKGPRF